MLQLIKRNAMTEVLNRVHCVLYPTYETKTKNIDECSQWVMVIVSGHVLIS